MRHDTTEPTPRPSVFNFMGRRHTEADAEDPVRRDMDALLQAEHPEPAKARVQVPIPPPPQFDSDVSLAELCEESVRASQFRAEKARDLQLALDAYAASRRRCAEINALVVERERSSGI